MNESLKPFQRPSSAEDRLRDLQIDLPSPPQPLGIYAMAVQSGRLLFLTGMLPTVQNTARCTGRVGAELGVDAARDAARIAALNALAVIRAHAGSLDRVARIVRLSVFMATTADFLQQPRVADGASIVLQNVFGEARNPSRLVFGVQSLPLGVPVELELIVELEED